MRESNVPRRHFLATSAATVAGAVLGAGAVPRIADALTESATATPRHRPAAAEAIKLGIASYSLRNFPLDRALEMMKTLRTPYVNFKSVHAPYETSPQERAAIRQRVHEAGFRIVGGGTIEFAKDDDDDVKTLFTYARDMGMPLIVATCNPPVVPRLEKFAKQFDIKVAIHNHGPEDTKFPSPYDVLAVVKNLDPRVGLCIDIGHTVRTGTDVVKAIGDAGPRVLDLHAKDLRDLKDKASQCIVGEGAIPFPEIFRALERVRFGGFVNLEYEIDADDPLPGMKQSFAYMRGVLAGMASTTRS
jgi:sugar phosphate isomerase/epimerase